jgi:DNA-binding Lrp family transcriptional regulator
MGDWTFFSNYGHVLVCLARNRQARLRDVAQEVGITERAVQKIVRDMQDAGFLTISKQGRCNRYRINKRKSLRHGLESHCTVGKLLALVARPVSGPIETAEVETKIQEAVASEAPPVTAEPAAASKPVVKAPPPPEKKKQSKKEESRKTGPVDVRQQGSLF